MKTNTLDFDAQALRERILDLAMRGKLVPQDPNDEPAIVLLEKIKAEKEELVKEKKIKKTKALPEITDDEKPFDIPDSWEWVRLGEIGEVFAGGDKPKDFSDIKDSQHKFPIYSNGIENKGLYGFTSKARVKRPALTLSARGTIGHVEYRDTPYLPIIRLISFVPYDDSYLKCIFYFLQSNQLVEKGDGSSIPQLTVPKLKPKVIPLPPLSEQSRIAAKIAQLFALLRKVELSTQQYAELQTLLKSKVLDLAMRGKLVKQDPDDEPASVLLEKIKAEKAELVKEKKIKKSKPLPPITDEEKPFDIPDSWEWVRLGDIFSINDRNKADDNLNVGFLPMKNIKDGYNNSFSVEQKKWGEVRKGYTHIRVGDIALSKITPCFQNRKSCVITDLPNKIGAATTEIYALYPMLPVLSDLYIYFLKSSFFIAEGTKNFTGNVGQQRVPKKFVEDFVIPLPPEKEISRIITKIENLFKML